MADPYAPDDEYSFDEVFVPADDYDTPATEPAVDQPDVEPAPADYDGAIPGYNADPEPADYDIADSGSMSYDADAESAAEPDFAPIEYGEDVGSEHATSEPIDIPGANDYASPTDEEIGFIAPGSPPEYDGHPGWGDRED